MLTADEQDVLQRLERWRDRMTTLQRMFDDHGALTRQYVEVAKERYTALKRDLIAEHGSLSNSRRDPPLTAAEVRWYARPIGQARFELLVPVNARPEKWRNSLSTAKFHITSAIKKMQAKS